MRACVRACLCVRMCTYARACVCAPCGTSVHAEVAGVLVQGVQGGDVGRPLHHLVHPLDGAHHLVALVLREHRGALVLRYLRWQRQKQTEGGTNTGDETRVCTMQ